jgi:hypothetical protein
MRQLGLPVLRRARYGRTMRYALITALLLAGCADFPALDSTDTAQARATPFPALAPLTPNLTDAAPQDQAAITDRIARLQRRADDLRAMDQGALQ